MTEKTVAAILRRDARRTTLLMWLLAVLWAFLGWTSFTFARGHYNASMNTRGAYSEFSRVLRHSPSKTPETLALLELTHYEDIQASHNQVLPIFAGTLFICSVATTALVHLNFRATLRQIHTGLADISAQLADLRQKTAGTASR
jgi:hypothetical protein